MATHYTASGWLRDEDEDGLIELVSRGAQEGEAEPLSDIAEYRVLRSEDQRFQFWVYAAYGQVRGAVPYVSGPVSWRVTVDRLLPRITGGMGSVELHRVDDDGYRFCAEAPDFGRLADEDVGRPHEGCVTGLAYACRVVPREEEHLCISRLDAFGMRSDASVSMGESSRCDILACGPITSAEMVTNPLTGLAVWFLAIEALGLPLGIAATPESVEGDEPEPGRLLEGVYWLVARLRPAPPADHPGLLGWALRRLGRFGRPAAPRGRGPSA
jgi:hypothetical protein